MDLIKFLYSEKAPIFYKISTVDLYYVVTVKSTVEISQNFVVFSEYMNFTFLFLDQIGPSGKYNTEISAILLNYTRTFYFLGKTDTKFDFCTL